MSSISERKIASADEWTPRAAFFRTALLLVVVCGVRPVMAPEVQSCRAPAMRTGPNNVTIRDVTLSDHRPAGKRGETCQPDAKADVRTWQEQLHVWQAGVADMDHICFLSPTAGHHPAEQAVAAELEQVIHDKTYRKMSVSFSVAGIVSDARYLLVWSLLPKNLSVIPAADSEYLARRCLGQVKDAGSACSTQIEAQEVFSIASPCAGLGQGSALHVRFLAVDLWPSQEWISSFSVYSLGFETQHRLLMSREDSIKLPPLIASSQSPRIQLLSILLANPHTGATYALVPADGPSEWEAAQRNVRGGVLFRPGDEMQEDLAQDFYFRHFELQRAAARSRVLSRILVASTACTCQRRRALSGANQIMMMPIRVCPAVHAHARARTHSTHTRHTHDTLQTRTTHTHTIRRST
jgi:hypothetical protein